jgi:crotonobetainyl-CoA:carnitine CoA-transferase CaiB-like acyl-CoA transferase
MALILDLTRLSAVYGPRLLAEAGHRLIRIEPPAGDDVRRLGPFLRHQVDVENGAYHQFLNAGKESLSLDIESQQARDILRGLVRSADCVIVTRPFAYDAEWFLHTNPRIAVVAVDDVPNELCAYARSGLLSLTGHPGQRPVLLGGHAVLSVIGLYVAVAASAALLTAQATQTGQHVEVSARQCMESPAEQALLTWHTTGKPPERRGFRGAITAVSGAFPCADGYWMISVPNGPQGWARLMDWVNDPELKADSTLADEGVRQVKRDFILDRVSDWSRQHNKEDLVTQAQERHIPASPVATVLDLAQDPQLIARGFLREIEHPDFGIIRFPVGATASRLGVTLAPAPRLGQHNVTILAELGYSEAEAQALRESGAA